MAESENALRARQYFQQGLAFMGRGQLAEAIEALRVAVRTAPEHVEARLKLGLVLQKRGRPDEGLQVLDAGLARTNVDTELRIRLLQQAAACATAMNDYAMARAYLEQALEVGGSHTHTLNQVAAICCKGGEFSIGFDYFLKASNEEPAE